MRSSKTQKHFWQCTVGATRTSQFLLVFGFPVAKTLYLQKCVDENGQTVVLPVVLPKASDSKLKGAISFLVLSRVLVPTHQCTHV